MAYKPASDMVLIEPAGSNHDQSLGQFLDEELDDTPLVRATRSKDTPVSRKGWVTVNRLFNGLQDRPVLVAFGVVALLLLCASTISYVRSDHDHSKDESQLQRFPSYLARGRNGAVATELDVCSKIGIDVLRDGGTATDAAIGGTLCVGVINSFSSGIGGGGFMVIRPPGQLNGDTNDSIPLSTDFRETSPSRSHAKMCIGKGKEATVTGGLAVGVPGELRGFEEAYKRFGGGVSWKQLFEPSIQLAEEGFSVSPLLADVLHKLERDFMNGKKEWEETFLRHGKLVKTGDRIYRKKYAQTLREIADGGADVFYKGPMAESSIRTIRNDRGIMTLEDLANYKANVVPAVRANYRNKTIYTTHPPSSGNVLVHLLKILESFNLEDGPTPRNIHRIAEAEKFAFAARSKLGDPAFNPQQASFAEEILSEAYSQEIAVKITDNQTHSIDYYGAEFATVDDHGTTHIVAVDANGSACSITYTVNLWFGAWLMDADTGIIFNDEQDDFSVPGKVNFNGLYPSPHNFPDYDATKHIGKRPLSSTSPAIIDDEDGNLYIALGGSGGGRIFPSVAQVILGLAWGYDLLHAVDGPRVQNQLMPLETFVEEGYLQEVYEGLKKRGHNVTLDSVHGGGASIQAIMRSPDG